jgi:hypothetical protein
MAKFSKTEQEVVSIFQKAMENFDEIDFMKKKCKIITVGKPTSPKGEPKTDVYILLEDTEEEKYEIKVSIKQGNADFLENKIQANRAEQLFGQNWSDIIQRSTYTIKDKFEQKTLIFLKKEGRTEEGAITLGWKFELLNKSGGELSGQLEVSALEVYTGMCLSKDKRDAFVNGKIIKGSGIAEYMLIVEKEEDITTSKDILSALIPIRKYVVDNPIIYFACKALNLRTKNDNKWDGDRPLAVYVDWSIQNGKLKHTINYAKPLVTKGNSIAENLISCLKTLDIVDTDDIKI